MGKTGANVEGSPRARGLCKCPVGTSRILPSRGGKQWTPKSAHPARDARCGLLVVLTLLHLCILVTYGDDVGTYGDDASQLFQVTQALCEVGPSRALLQHQEGVS